MSSPQVHDQQPGQATANAGRKLIAQKYVLLKPQIGEGSFAKVYKGKNVESDEVVAIKEISWSFIRRRSPEFIEKHSQNMRNETECLQSLDHPNIVKLLGFENTPEYFYMVLEFCAGGDLAQSMNRRHQEPLEEHIAQGLIRQLVAGLHAMRKLNWVHRDLKPGNLLLSRANLQDAAWALGGLKIGDFGFARDLAPEGLAETWVGSRLYMAPEILFNARGGYTAKADLWSVGCILFELLHGRAPFGSAPRCTEADLRDDILRDRRFVCRPPPSLSDPCRELVDALLKRDPAERLAYEVLFEHAWISGVAPVSQLPLQGRLGLIAGKYVLIPTTLLGEGSFASVYQGKNQETGEVVAIKEVSWLKIRRRSPDLIERHKQNLRNETECLQSLDHPNIVKLLGFDNTVDRFYMVLEYCSGGDLAQAMARRRQEPVEELLARGLIRQLAAGLQAMRKLNWVHRDLKPGNLLLSRASLQEAASSEGGLKIGDFGFARDLAPEGLAETWVGSRLYMAPEILFLRESGGYTAKADLWSVGCIMFELLHGRAPYGSGPRCTEADLRRDIAEDRRYARTPPPTLSDACRDLLSRLLQRRPEGRLSYEEFFDHRWVVRLGSSVVEINSSSGGTRGSGSSQQRIIAKKYLLVLGSALGEGSFATVYKGRNQETGEDVAIKEVSLVKFRRRSPELMARHHQNLRNETECLQSLDHPNIVKLLAHESTSRHYYIVLEYCSGGDLAVAMRARHHKPLDEAVAQGMIRQLAAGLQAMRRLNWVHRDLKPGNLLLTRSALEEAASVEGGLKIGDFGFARDLAPEGLAETWVGSRLYMAPEILFRASGGYTAKADLWSVGCIMFELLQGRPPYGAQTAGAVPGAAAAHPGGPEARLREDIRRDRRFTCEPPVIISPPGRELLDRLLQANPVERASYCELFRHPWIRGSNAGTCASSAAEQLQRSEMLRSRLTLVVSEALEGSPASGLAGSMAQSRFLSPAYQHAPLVTAPLIAVSTRADAERAWASPGRLHAHGGGLGGALGASGMSYGNAPATTHARAGHDAPLLPPFSEDFELIGSGLDLVFVDSPAVPAPDLGGGGVPVVGRRDSIIDALPSEVASVAAELDLLLRDVACCCDAAARLADEELEREPGARPGHALVLYMWSVKLFLRSLAQLDITSSRCGELLPSALATDWRGLLRRRLTDDFDRAKGALRRCLESSCVAGSPWATPQGRLRESAMSSPAAPPASRLAFGAAMRTGRQAATDEILFSRSWEETRPLYCQAVLLLCAVLLDGDLAAEDLGTVEGHAGLLVRRILTGPDLPRATAGLEYAALLRRCGQPRRLHRAAESLELSPAPWARTVTVAAGREAGERQ